jgi:hypothetical protein
MKITDGERFSQRKPLLYEPLQYELYMTKRIPHRTCCQYPSASLYADLGRRKHQVTDLSPIPAIAAKHVSFSVKKQSQEIYENDGKLTS